MNERDLNRLDLLQRFLPAPYRFSVDIAGNTVHIESNDLEIALALREHCMTETADAAVHHWSIMRDHKAQPADHIVTLIADETLRTLFAGQQATLMFDRALHKVFGFIGSMSVDYVVTDLLPLLIAGQISAAVTNK